MKGLADKMQSAGKHLDDDLVSYILANMDVDFNPVVTSVANRTKAITVGELFARLVSFETRMESWRLSTAGKVVTSAADVGATITFFPWKQILIVRFVIIIASKLFLLPFHIIRYFNYFFKFLSLTKLTWKKSNTYKIK